MDDFKQLSILHMKLRVSRLASRMLTHSLEDHKHADEFTTTPSNRAESGSCVKLDFNLVRRAEVTQLVQ